jgi:hypothetical protein
MSLAGRFLPLLSLTIASLPLSAATDEFHNAVIADMPILYYQFNEPSGNAINYGSLGATHDATYNGSVTRGASTLAGDDAVAFDGVDDYLESLGTAPASVLGNPTFSVEAIVFVPTNGSVTAYGPLLHWGTSSSGNHLENTGESVYFSFSNSNPTEIFAGFYNGGLQSPTGSFALGRWHHVVWVRTGGGAANVGSKLYVDGVDLTSALQNDPDLCCNTTTPAVEASEFRINRARDLTRFFVGSLDEVALYDKVLTVTDVSQHFAAAELGVALDIDGNGVKDPLTDGLLALRYLFGFRGATLISGAVNLSSCTRCTAVAIEAYLASL